MPESGRLYSLYQENSVAKIPQKKKNSCSHDIPSITSFQKHHFLNWEGRDVIVDTKITL
jgi:hypothetical protein